VTALALLAALQEDHSTCKKLTDEMLAWLSGCSEVQMICIWSSWCHWCRLTQVLLEEAGLNRCLSVCLPVTVPPSQSCLTPEIPKWKDADYSILLKMFLLAV